MNNPARISPQPVPELLALVRAYSTTLQSSLSIDDQLRVCSDLCAARGLDRRRPALRRGDLAARCATAPASTPLLERPRADTVVVAEAIDRLSRDQEDIAAIFKRCATPARGSGR
jgi:site-specific DNA recombinase